MIDFEYSVVRNPRRKSLQIFVSLDNKVTVRAPDYATDNQIAEILESQSQQVRAQFELNGELRGSLKPKAYVTGQPLTYMGRIYRLDVRSGDSNRVLLKQGRFIVHAPADTEAAAAQELIEARLKAWYKARASRKLKERAGLYAAQIGAGPRSIAVKSLKTRWGSCSTRGDITYNWKIIAAPLKIIDYVVVHELCHLLHQDHSPAFWSLVASVLPDYLERKGWLKHNDRLCLCESLL